MDVFHGFTVYQIFFLTTGTSVENNPSITSFFSVLGFICFSLTFSCKLLKKQGRFIFFFFVVVLGSDWFFSPPGGSGQQGSQREGEDLVRKQGNDKGMQGPKRLRTR